MLTSITIVISTVLISQILAALTLIPGSRASFRSLHPGQCLGYPSEQVLDVVADLCTCLDEHQIILLRLFLSLLCCDLAFVVKIGLISNQDNDDIVAPLTTYIVHPFPRVLE